MRKKNYKRFIFSLFGFFLILLIIFIESLQKNSAIERGIVLLKEGQFLRVIDKIISLSGESITRYITQFMVETPDKAGIPIYKLKLSPKDVASISKYSSESLKSGEKIDSLNKWREASLEFNGKKTTLQFKIHGTATDHYRDRKKSFSFKSTEKINGLTRFVLSNNTFLETVFFYKLLNLLDIMKVKSEFVYLFVNNENFGLYVLEEKLNSELLEKNGFANSVILKTKPDYKNFHSKGHATTYDLSTYNVEAETILKLNKKNDSQIQKSKLFSDLELQKTKVAIARLDDFFNAIKQKNKEKILNFIDIESFAKVEAYRFLTGRVHFIIGDNRRLIYNFSNGKFLFFFPRPEDGIKEIKKIPEQVGRFESQFYEYKVLGSKQISFIASTLATIPEFREKRNFYLYNFLKKKDLILELYSDLYEDYRFLLLNDYSKFYDKNLSNTIESFRKEKAYFANNLKILSDYLDYSRAFLKIDVYNKYLNLSIAVDSNSPQKISKLEINFNKLDENLKTLSNHKINLHEKIKNYNFLSKIDNYQTQFLDEKKIKIDGEFQNIVITKADFSIKNKFNDININNEKVRVIITNKQTRGEILDKIESVRYLKQKGAIEKENFLLLPKGKYNISKTLDLEGKLGIKIMPGVTIKLQKNTSFVGILFMIAEGNKKLPIKFQSNTEDSFGSLVINGNNLNSCYFNYFSLRNGSESLVNGVYSSAALHISRCNTFMTNSEISNNTSEDGLNIKDSKVFISKSTFFDNFADQVDFDNVSEGIIKNSIFIGGEQYNGDGIDLSNSNAMVYDNEFKNFKDKSISIGEGSRALLVRNKIKENAIGIAIKDSSYGFLYKNFFQNNTIDLTSYVKKSFFQKPTTIFFDKNESKNLNKQIIDGFLDNYRTSEEMIQELDKVEIDQKIFEKLLSLKIQSNH